MKTRSPRSLPRLLLKIAFFANSYYTDQIYEMERTLGRKPRRFQIDLVGSGELPPDSALLIRSMLLKRSTRTHLITNARSSLQGASVLVWLLGDTRLMLEDAKLYFRAVNEEETAEVWNDEDCKPFDSSSETDLEEVDYAQVLEHINQFLPVKELAGRLIDAPLLRQFGLVDNEKVDQFLAAAFAKTEQVLQTSGTEAEKNRVHQIPKPTRSDQPKQTD